MQATNTVIKTTRKAPLKSAMMGDVWEEKQARSRKAGKLNRGQARINNRSRWEV